jgi:uncharacterized damage-inducible protein DinB
VLASIFTLDCAHPGQYIPNKSPMGSLSIMQADQARFLFDFLYPHLKVERVTTRKIIAAVPEDRSGYAPHPKSRTALQLCGHIAGTQMWFLDAILNRAFSEDDDAPPPKWDTPAEIVRWYDESFEARILKLEALSDQHLATPVSYIGILNEPAVVYLSMAVRHSVHHRGQLSAYLRPMGAQVPAIYVESGDHSYVRGEPSGW